MSRGDCGIGLDDSSCSSLHDSKALVRRCNVSSYSQLHTVNTNYPNRTLPLIPNGDNMASPPPHPSLLPPRRASSKRGLTFGPRSRQLIQPNSPAPPPSTVSPTQPMPFAESSTAHTKRKSTSADPRPTTASKRRRAKP